MVNEKMCDTDKCLALNMAKENKARITKLEDEKEESKISIAVIASRLESLEKTMIEFGVKLDTLLQKPAKRWDGLVTVGIASVVSGVIAFVIGKLL